MNLRKFAVIFTGDGTVDMVLECDRQTDGRRTDETTIAHIAVV